MSVRGQRIETPQPFPDLVPARLAGGTGGLSATMARSLLFVATLLLAWISVTPFASLSDAHWLETGDTADMANQVAYVVLGGCAAAVLIRDRSLLGPLLRPAYGVMLLWLMVSVATSQHPDLSARRLTFLVFVILLGAAAPLLPANRERFGDLVAGVTASALFLCYAGVAILPELSIHQATDLVEPRLAGNWRGVFIHKNVAGEMMGIFVFVGLFVARVRSRWLGWGIVSAAVVFLIFSEAKTAAGFLPLTLLLAWTSRGPWAFRGRLAVFFLALIVLNTFSIGQLFSPEIEAITQRLFSDPTFTGRTEIWQVALDGIPKRPIFGFGYGAFWLTDELMYATSLVRDGGAAADHAHNAVLNLAVATGIPGALLAAFMTIVLPLRDLDRCARTGADPALANLFLRIWAFTIANCSFESILFARGDPMWFTLVLALVGMRYLSVYRLTGAAPETGPLRVSARQ